MSESTNGVRSADLAQPVMSGTGWSDLDLRVVDTARLLAADAVQRSATATPVRR